MAVITISALVAKCAGQWTTAALPTTTSTEVPSPVANELFPTIASAGVPKDWTPARTINGPFVVRRPGAIVEDLRINGSLIISATNVTIRRVEVIGGSINNFEGSTCYNDLVIENTTVEAGSGQTSGDFPAILAGGYTARGVLIDGLSEGFRVGGLDGDCGPVIIENSYARVVSPDICGDWHGDGVQGFDGPRR